VENIVSHNLNNIFVVLMWITNVKNLNKFQFVVQMVNIEHMQQQGNTIQTSKQTQTKYMRYD
jgi:hypothetical protein